MTSSTIHSFLPQLRETSFIMSAEEDEDSKHRSRSSTSSSHQRSVLGFNRIARTANDFNTSTQTEFIEHMLPRNSLSSDDGVATTSCLARSELAQRMYETMARVQSNRRSRRNRNLMQQQQQQQQSDGINTNNNNGNVGDSLEISQRAVDPSQSPSLSNKISKTIVSNHRGSPPPPTPTSHYIQPSRQSLQVSRESRPPTYHASQKRCDVASTSSVNLTEDSDWHRKNYYEPIGRNSAGNLAILDNSSIDTTSVGTGFSQQDLIRKKVRQQNRNRQKLKTVNNNTKNINNGSTSSKKKKKTTIVQIPTSLLPSSHQSARYYVKARSSIDVGIADVGPDFTIQSDTLGLWNSNEVSTKSTNQVTKDESDENIPPKRDTGFTDPDNQSVSSFPLLSRSAKSGGMYGSDSDPSVSRLASIEGMQLSPASGATGDIPFSGLTSCMDDKKSMSNLELERRRVPNDSVTNTKKSPMTLENAINPCETSFMTASTSTSSSTSVQSGNRVRFSESTITLFDPDDVPDKCTAVPVKYSRSISESEHSGPELPWDEIPPSKTETSQHSREACQVRSILRKPKFSGNASASKRRDSVDSVSHSKQVTTDNNWEDRNASSVALADFAAGRNIALRIDDGAPDVSTRSTGQSKLDVSMQSTSTDTSYSAEYQTLNTSDETTLSPSRIPLSPNRNIAFVDKEGIELSPIRPDRLSDVSTHLHVNALLMDEPVSHLAGHPAEKHWHETQLASRKSVPPLSPDVRGAEVINQPMVNELCIASPPATQSGRMRLSLYLEEKKDDDSERSSAKLLGKSQVDDESTIVSALDFIETVAAIVIQTSVRRYQALCLANSLSYTRHQHQCSAMDEDDQENYANRQEIEAGSPKDLSFEETLDSTKLGTIDAFLDLYEEAAIRIQAVFRSFWVRDSIDVDRYCASLIQKVFRGHACRRRYTLTYRRIVIVQSWWRRNIVRDYAGEIIGYVVWIQSIVRGYLVRQRVLEIIQKKRSSTSKLEPNVPYPNREAIASKDYVRSHEGAAAIVIQSRWRVYVSENRFIRSLVNILITQTVARRWLAIRYVNELRNSKHETSFQSHEEYCKDLESTLLSFEQKMDAQFPSKKSTILTVSNESLSEAPTFDDCGTFEGTLIKPDRAIICPERVKRTNCVIGAELEWNPVIVTQSGHLDSIPFDESVRLNRAMQMDRQHQPQIPPSTYGLTRTANVSRGHEQIVQSKLGSQEQLKRGIAKESDRVRNASCTVEEALVIDKNLDRRIAIQAGHYGNHKDNNARLVQSMTYPVQSTAYSSSSHLASSRTSGPMYTNSDFEPVNRSHANALKSHSNNSTTKSKRVEQFFKKSPTDAVVAARSNPPTVEDNDVYRWKQEEAKLNALLSQHIQDESLLGEIDLATTKNAMSVWKEKVKNNPGKVRNSY